MRFQTIALTVAIVFACVLIPATAVFPGASVARGRRGSAESETVQPVSGSGVHFLTTGSSTRRRRRPRFQRSTETIDLTGDLTGRILYHPTSVIDVSTQSLVNTGHQVFSGTVLGSEPVMLHDDTFRFDVDLHTGTGTGTVHLADRLDGPKVRCDLIVLSTGITADGNVAAEYTGECRFKNK